MPPIRPVLFKEITALQRSLVQLHQRADNALRLAVEALQHNDIDLAKELVRADTDINAMQVAIEEEGLKAIATQQPVAGDLRMLLADMHIAIELERVADHAADIGRLVISDGPNAPKMPLARIEAMAEHARAMLGAALEAYLNHDLDQAYALGSADDELDDLEDAAVDELLANTCVENGTKVRGTHLLWVVHKLERVGDRATNIAERVIFIEQGKNLDLNQRPVREPQRP